MNKEEYITQFREQVLPKYIELAKELEKTTNPIKGTFLSFIKCKVCGKVKSAEKFYPNHKVCMDCKKKERRAKYYKKCIEHCKQKITEYEKKLQQ